jgi:hypothetical protein
MKRRRAGVVVAALWMFPLVACQQQDASVRWELSVANVSGDVFAVRILLDGKEVFAQTSPMAASYTTTVEGRYELGEHLVECEITSAARPLGRYVAGVKYTIVSDGRAAIVDGVPTELRPGERLRLSISLAAEAGR